MGLLTDISYNYHKGVAQDYLNNKLKGQFNNEKYNGVKDAFCNAYAEIDNYAKDPQRYGNASDKELQNWHQGRKLYDENPGGWQQDLFDRFFGKDSNGEYILNPNSGFITDTSTPLSDFQRKQMIAGLMSGNYDYDPMQNVSKGFFDSFSAAMPVDPLVIDLDGDGIETTSLQNGYMMDYKNDGFSELTAWVGKDDGILVHDKNNNGVIDNGSELLGDNYTKTDGTLASSGFDALADFDSNGDGVINSSDTAFNDLKVFKGDGTLLTLEQAGIASINLSKQDTNTQDANGNTQLSTGSYVTTDGQTNSLGDFIFQTDNMTTIANDYVEVSETIQQLPDIAGTGTVYSLHQAMARDTSGELKQLVESFAAEGNSEQKRNILTQIIYKWTGADEIASDSRGNEIDAKILHALEQFMGEGFIGVEQTSNPNREASNLLRGSFSQLSTYIYAQLESQTTLKTLFDKVAFGVDEETSKNIFKLDAVQSSLDSAIASDATAGKLLLSDFAQTFVALGFSQDSNFSDFYDHFASLGEEYKVLLDTAGKVLKYGTDIADSIEGTAEAEAVFGAGGNDTIYTRQGNDIVYGGDGNDYIDTCEDDDIVFGENGNDTVKAGLGDDTVYGGAGGDSIDGGVGNNVIYGEDGNDDIICGSGDDYISGGDGDDTLSSNTGNDTVIGGRGNDIIECATGNKLILFNLGDGNDTITSAWGDDTLQFGDGLTKEHFKIRGEGTDVVMYFDNTSDSIRVTSFLFRGVNKIEKVVFADGSSYTFDEMFNMLVTYGTEGNDSIQSSMAGEVIYGYGGDDTILSGSDAPYIEGVDKRDTVYGGDGNDSISNVGSDGYLDGGAGNDTIYGGSLNDTIIGGTGNDLLNGGNGDNLFLFNMGDGNDTIYAWGNDTLQFGTGLTKENLKLCAEGFDLIMSFENTNDSIRVINYFMHESNHVENIVFSDGSTLTFDEIISSLETHGTEGNDSINGSVAGEVIYGYGGNDTIICGSDVTYIDINKNDTVYGGDGNDSIRNSGSVGYLDGGAGNDTIESGNFNDTIIGGTGDDLLNGGNGDDIYIFNSGDGCDTIQESSGNDTIQFGEGLTKENFQAYGEGNDVIVNFKNSTDSIRLVNFLNGTYGQIESFKFADGSIYTPNDVLSMLTTYGTEGNDSITGSIVNDKVYGYGGNDTIKSGIGDDTVYGGNGDDSIDAGAGNNIVYGESGNDSLSAELGNNLLDGGSGDDFISVQAGGNDTIIGGKGNDTISTFKGDKLYIFNAGDGSDIIRSASCNDTIQFGAGLTKENLQVHCEGYHLYVSFKNTNDLIYIENFALYENGKVECFKFADGTTYSDEDILNMLETQGTQGDDRMYDSFVGEVIYGNEGNDTIDAGSQSYGYTGNNSDTVYGGAGDDWIRNTKTSGYLDGGSGNDIVDGGNGNDTIIGGTGDDLLRGANGNDLYLFNLGDGNDSVYDYSGQNRIELNNDVSLNDIAIFRDSANNLFIDYGQESGNDIIQITQNTYQNFDSITLKGETDYTISDSAINKLIQDMSAYAAENGISISSVSDVKENADLMNLVSTAWTNAA